MPKITFTQDRVVDDYRKGTPDEEKFLKDETYTMSDASAALWTSAGVAVYFVEPAVSAEPVLKPAKTKA